MFARPSNAEKAIVERQTVEELARALAPLGDVITNVHSVTRDPPDCTALLNGTLVAIELAELLNGKVLHKIAAARRGVGKLPTWDELQWTRELFKQHIDAIISKKESKLSRVELDTAATVLLIHTDELWLEPNKVDEWLIGLEFEATPNIGRAYLLCTYDSRRGPAWPVFRLF